MVAGSILRRGRGLTDLRVGASVAGVRLQQLLSVAGRTEIWRGTWPDGRPATVHGLAHDHTKLERDVFLTGARKLVVAGRQRRLRTLVSVAAVVPGAPAYVTRTRATATMADLAAFQWDLKRCLAFARALAKGLRALHRVGFIHGCALPHNVLLDDDRQPILSDVGVVSIGQSYGRGRHADHAYAPYCAPEVRRGNRPSMRADVYSFGRLLAFTLTGLAPEPDDAELPVLSELQDQPEGLVRIIRRCTVAKRDDRYATFEDVLSELANYQDVAAVGLGLSRPSANFGRAAGVDFATSGLPPAPSSEAPEDNVGTAATQPPPGWRSPSQAPAASGQTRPARSWSHPVTQPTPPSNRTFSGGAPASAPQTVAEGRAARPSDVDGRYGAPASARRARLSEAARHISGIDGAAVGPVVDLTELDEQLRSAGRVDRPLRSPSTPSQPELSQLRDSGELASVSAAGFAEQPLPLMRASTPPGGAGSRPYRTHSSGPYAGRISSVPAADSGVSGPYSASPSGPYANGGGVVVSSPPSWSPRKTQPAPKTQPSGHASATTLRPSSHQLGGTPRPSFLAVSTSDTGPQELLTESQARLAAVAGFIVVVGALGYSYARAAPTTAALVAATVGAVLLSLALPRLLGPPLLWRLAAGLMFAGATWLLNPTALVAGWARTNKLTRGSPQERGMRIQRLRERGELYFGELDLRATDFTNMDLSHARFDGSDLRGAKFNRAVLRGASLANANVTGADFSGAVLDGVDISALDGWRSSTCDAKTSLPAPWLCQRGLPVVR